MVSRKKIKKTNNLTKTKLKQSLAKLCVSYIPKQLKCRKKETQKLTAIIKNFISIKISIGSGLCFIFITV